MNTSRFLPLAPLLVALLLSSPVTFGQQTKATASKTAATRKTAVAPQPKGPVEAESLSGLDLIPNRRTGQFAVRIRHRISQPATLRLIDTKTSRIIRTELLQPSEALARAVTVGKLPYGEYKMEVMIPDTTYWKTVRVRR